MDSFFYKSSQLSEACRRAQATTQELTNQLSRDVVFFETKSDWTIPGSITGTDLSRHISGWLDPNPYLHRHRRLKSPSRKQHGPSNQGVSSSRFSNKSKQVLILGPSSFPGCAESFVLYHPTDEHSSSRPSCCSWTHPHTATRGSNSFHDIQHLAPLRSRHEPYVCEPS